MDISVEDISRDWEGVLKGLTEGQYLRLSKEAEREFGKRSTYYLAKHILGYDKLSNDFHVAMCRFYDKHLYDLQLHLHPRKHYKSTLITIAGKIRMALVDPDITIAIIANTLHNSQTFLREIRNHFISTDKFRDLYPEHAVSTRREEGVIDRFTTPARLNQVERIATFEAASADRALVSRHYKHIIFDDFVDDKNTATRELMDKLYENYSTSLAVTSVNNAGLPWHHIVGTRWNYNDAYQRILDENKVTKHFHVLLTQAYWKGRNPDGTIATQYLFPAEFPPEYLDFLRKTLGTYRFSCLYLNSPAGEDELALDPDFLTLFNEKSNPALHHVRHAIITVDPASTYESNRGDSTVVALYEIDHDSNIYIRDIQRGHWNPDEIIEHMITMHKAYGVRRIGIESMAFQKWLCFYLEKRRQSEYLSFRVEPIRRAPNEKKNKRLERIQPYLRSGKIHVRENEPELEALRKELREFPHGQHDDILDTLADAIELLKPPHKTKKEHLLYRVPPVTLPHYQRIQTGYTYRAGG